MCRRFGRKRSALFSPGEDNHHATTQWQSRQQTRGPRPHTFGNERQSHNDAD